MFAQNEARYTEMNLDISRRFRRYVNCEFKIYPKEAPQTYEILFDIIM
jgi:hypothetical protein